ncbi:MAG: calcium/sodium antiporter [PVC group bacterium]|nr:calcium/sodium antiporter [PVC group bacterium]
MSIYADFIIFIIGIFVIIKSADFFTSGAEIIASFFKIPRIIIGLTIVSIATTMPEFTVSALSAYMGKGDIAVGNATGSCLANIGLILAVAAIIRNVKFNPMIVKQELIFLMGICAFLFFLAWDGKLDFKDGILLCAMLGAFFSYITTRELRARKNRKEEKSGPEPDIKKGSIKFLIGAAGVILSAKYAIIPSGINIAHYFKIPEIVIGITMIAVGTSLPELATAIIASVKKMEDLAAGNVIGANILNILWVLGVSSAIRPLDIDIKTKMLTIPVMFVFAACVFLFARTKLVLTRKEGITLLLLYAGYIIYIVKFAYN